MTIRTCVPDAIVLCLLSPSKQILEADNDEFFRLRSNKVAAT